MSTTPHHPRDPAEPNLGPQHLRDLPSVEPTRTMLTILIAALLIVAAVLALTWPREAPPTRTANLPVDCPAPQRDGQRLFITLRMENAVVHVECRTAHVPLITGGKK